MRKYYIHFEPFFDSIENGFMGIDLNFHSELLVPTEIVKILDKTFEKMVSKSDGLENELCQEFGLKDVELSTYKTSTSWLKDGEYFKYSRKRTNQEMATYPDDEVHLNVLSLSGKPYSEELGFSFDDILVVDYKSSELCWTYEIKCAMTSAQPQPYGHILVRDDSLCEKSPNIMYIGSENGPETYMVDEHFRRWNCPLLHVLFYPHMRRIIENIGGVTMENILEVAPSYNDLVKYIPNLD